MFQNREEALLVINEIDSLRSTGIPVFLDYNFKAQADFVKDDSSRVAALCTRRAGKSYGVGLKLFRAAYREPMSSILYLGLTRATSKRIMWKDVIKQIDRNFNLNCKFNESELTATTSNGSVIYFAGADSTRDEMEKVLGGKLKLAVIDEAGSFRQDLRKLCYEMIEPALADYDGTLVMVGTPTDLLNSLFHTATDKAKGEPGWSVHYWNTTDNPYMKDNWEKRLSALKLNQPDIESTPFFRRMYLGEWVTDLSSLVYKYNQDKNMTDKLPAGKYYYVLGIDLGFNDPTAFVVAAYREDDNTCYMVEAYKASNMIISDVAQRIAYYTSKYDFHSMVVDNAAKQSVEELKQRFGFPLRAAEKQGKSEFIEIMNSEMMLGRIKVLPEALSLAEEWNSLIWDERSDKRIEHPSCANHLSDAANYAFKHCLAYLYLPVKKKTITAEDEVDEWFEKESDKIVSRETTPFWEKEFV
jgi:PBSX family phage terminase large subunit